MQTLLRPFANWKGILAFDYLPQPSSMYNRHTQYVISMKRKRYSMYRCTTFSTCMMTRYFRVSFCVRFSGRSGLELQKSQLGSRLIS